jgi:hypothetical protein
MAVRVEGERRDMTKRAPAATQSIITSIADEFDERMELVLEPERVKDATKDRIRAAAVAELVALLDDTL